MDHHVQHGPLGRAFSSSHSTAQYSRPVAHKMDADCSALLVGACYPNRYTLECAMNVKGRRVRGAGGQGLKCVFVARKGPRRRVFGHNMLYDASLPYGRRATCCATGVMLYVV